MFLLGVFSKNILLAARHVFAACRFVDFPNVYRSEEDITKLVYKRHAQSFTASSLEMLLSAAYQVSHPLPTKASPTGHFSSRFVTCCLTGTEERGIDVIAWQASEHAEAMVKAGIGEASVDPGVVRVRKPGQGEYIPEVFYRWVKTQLAL